MSEVSSKKRTALWVMRVLFTLFMAGTLVLIFTSSSKNAELSGAASTAATAWLNEAAGGFGIGFTFTEGLVRKLGHLGEYALLGFWTMLTLRVYTKRIIAFSAWPMLLGLGVAVVDEFYQTTVPGRTGLVSDVVIDFAGVMLGLCLAMFLQLLAGAFWHWISSRRRG